MGDFGPLVEQYDSFPFCPLVPALKEVFDRNPFPDIIDQKECQTWTMEFAYRRMRLDRLQRGLNPAEITFISTYPLPIGAESMMPIVESMKKPPTPFVERDVALAGLAVCFEKDGTIGWFIGLVEHIFVEPEKMDENYWVQVLYQFDFPILRFIDGMILLEGKLDESIIGQLKDFETYYKRKILGMKIGGRPRIDPTAMMYAAREILKVNPDISQEKLTEKLGIPDISTFKKYRKAADFPTYEDLRKSVKKS